MSWKNIIQFIFYDSVETWIYYLRNDYQDCEVKTLYIRFGKFLARMCIPWYFNLTNDWERTLARGFGSGKMQVNCAFDFGFEANLWIYTTGYKKRNKSP